LHRFKIRLAVILFLNLEFFMSDLGARKPVTGPDLPSGKFHTENTRGQAPQSLPAHESQKYQ